MDRFQRAAGELRRALGNIALRIDHIGSTAVPGLPAKPVIDIQVSVPSLEPSDPYDRPLQSLGFALLADPEEPQHRFYRRPEERPRLVNVHVCESGGAWERRHLVFRDYLRAFAAVKAEYGDLKRRAAERHSTNRYDYTDAKGPFILEVERKAKGWAHGTRWRPGPSDA